MVRSSAWACSHGEAVAQAPFDEVASLAAIGELLRCRREGQEDVGDGGVLHRFGEDTDDGVGALIEFDGAAQDSRIAGEAALPEAIVEHGDGVTTGAALAVAEQVSKNGLNAQEIEEVCGRRFNMDVGRVAGAGETHIRSAAYGELFEGAAAQGPILVIGESHTLVGTAILPFGDGDHAIHRRDSEGTQNDRIHAAEDRSVGSDADGDAENRSDREAGRLDQLTSGVAQVGPEALQRKCRVGCGDSLARSGGIPEA